MYGEVNYKLSFDFCGYGSGTANLTVKYDDFKKIHTPVNKPVSYTGEWKTFTFDIYVSEEMTECEGAIFVINGDSSAKIPFFALKNFSLIKVE